jgi:hypothetical protein
MWHDLQLPLLNTHDIHFTRVLLNADRSRSSTPAITCTHIYLHFTLYTLPGTHVWHKPAPGVPVLYTFYTSCR